MSHAKLTNSIIVANEDRKVEYTLEFSEQVNLYVFFRVLYLTGLFVLGMLYHIRMYLTVNHTHTLSFSPYF